MDPAQVAQLAREKLANALNALQTNANVPDELMAVADPIAEAMSILHRIERTDGKDLAGRDEALDHVRTALDLLQALDVVHPAMDPVMENVATSLSKVHQLAKYAPPAPQPAPAPAPVAPAPAARAPAAPAPAAPAPAPVAPNTPARGPNQTVMLSGGNAIPRPEPKPHPAAAAPAPQPAPAAQPAPQPGPAPPPAPPPAPAPQPVPQPAPQPAPAAHPAAAHPAAAHPAAAHPAAFPSPGPSPMMAPMMAGAAAMPPAQAQANPYAAPQAAMPQAAMPQAAMPQAPVAHPPYGHAPAPSPSQTGNVVVELGANSGSNFYKGLSGNDVIDHGGIFVATYKIPAIGTPVALRVLLPGDYEFQASAVVQWAREPASGDADPGFGAKFTQISQEGRQLVYRYTRNREPLFYDDL